MVGSLEVAQMSADPIVKSNTEMRMQHLLQD